MIISIINHTNGKLSDEDVQHVLRAINRQVKEDFEPYWSLGDSEARRKDGEQAKTHGAGGFARRRCDLSLGQR